MRFKTDRIKGLLGSLVFTVFVMTGCGDDVNVGIPLITVEQVETGVEAGTERAWELCEKYKLPRMIYVTGMDADNALASGVLSRGEKPVPPEMKIRSSSLLAHQSFMVSIRPCLSSD